MHPFSQGALSDVLRAHLAKVVADIKALDSEYVLKASVAELENHFVDAAGVTPLVLRVDEKTIGERIGVDVDVSHDFRRAVLPGHHAVVRGTKVRVDIPFDGDAQLWKFRPSSFFLSGYPDLDVSSNLVSLSYIFPDDSADAAGLRQEIERDVSTLRQTVGNIASDVSMFNAAVPQHVRTALETRLRRAKETTDAVAGLGIPLKRADVPPAYAIPTRRLPSPRTLPSVEIRPYQAEPFLRIEEYEHILGILKSMALVIERNPQSFAAMDEESIRTHFLLHLNGHYEGDASGETFNAQGKTDILIHEKDRNVFIAECKFWRGAKAFDRAITQLLGYLSWRDSKCALLIFNRTKNSSAVSDEMHAVVMARPEFRKYVGLDANGDRRYTFVKPSDPGREITITTMLFDMPQSDA